MWLGWTFGTASVCLGIWLIIGLSVYFAGYRKDTLINESLYPTQGLVVQVNDYLQVCFYTSCTNNGKTCITIYYDCWNHYATFEWTPDPNLVVENSTQQTSVYLWNDASVSQGSYLVGVSYSGYYNICPLIPRFHSDQVICSEHGNLTPYFLKLTDQWGTYNASIASLVFICLFGLIIILGLCYLICLRVGDYFRDNPIVIQSPPVVVYVPEEPPRYLA